MKTTESILEQRRQTDPDYQPLNINVNRNAYKRMQLNPLAFQSFANNSYSHQFNQCTTTPSSKLNTGNKINFTSKSRTVHSPKRYSNAFLTSKKKTVDFLINTSRKEGPNQTTLKEMLGNCIEKNLSIKQNKLSFNKILKKANLYDFPQGYPVAKSFQFANPNSTNFFRASFNQHLNCNIPQPSKLNYVSKQQLIDTILLNKQEEEINQQVFKIHQKPSRCLDLPKYPTKFIKLLNLYEGQRILKNSDSNQQTKLSIKNLNQCPTIPQNNFKNKLTIKTDINKFTDEIPQVQDLLFKILANPISTQNPEENKILRMSYNSSQTQQLVNGNDYIKEDEIPMSPGKKIQKIDNQLFGNKVMRQVLNQQTKKFYNRNEKALKMQRIRLALITTINYLNKLRISSKEFMENQIFSSRPFEKPRSKEFLTACKSNNLNQLNLLLEANRYLVYDYDNLMMTGLHWAAKRGNFDIAMKLLSMGADPDAQDIVGRSPLYLAIQNKNNDIVQILMYKQADPWSKDNCDYGEVLGDNPEAQSILSSSRKKVHILLRMTPPSLRQQIWQKEQLAFYIDPQVKENE